MDQQALNNNKNSPMFAKSSNWIILLKHAKTEHPQQHIFFYFRDILFYSKLYTELYPSNMGFSRSNLT